MIDPATKTEEIKLLLYATNTLLIFYVLRRVFNMGDAFLREIGANLKDISGKLSLLISSKDHKQETKTPPPKPSGSKK